jgi:hypothetical protein
MEEKLDLVWGAKAIGEEIGTTEPQTHYLLGAGLIRCARHIGKRWVADRQNLRREFSGGPDKPTTEEARYGQAIQR